MKTTKQREKRSRARLKAALEKDMPKNGGCTLKAGTMYALYSDRANAYLKKDAKVNLTRTIRTAHMFDGIDGNSYIFDVIYAKTTTAFRDWRPVRLTRYEK